MSIGSIDIWLDDPLTVELNPGGGNPFATIQLTPSPGKAWIGVRTPADADELIKAAVAAKDILTAAHRATAEQAAKDLVPAPGPTAPDAEDHTGHSASGSSEDGGTA